MTGTGKFGSVKQVRRARVLLGFFAHLQNNQHNSLFQMLIIIIIRYPFISDDEGSSLVFLEKSPITSNTKADELVRKRAFLR